MLMVDVNATVMQAMISVNRLIRFRHKLTAGKMSSVTGFDFARDPSTSSSSTKGVELVQSSKKENFPEKYSIKSKKQTQTMTDLASVVPIGVHMILNVTPVGHATILATVKRYVAGLNVILSHVYISVLGGHEKAIKTSIICGV
ncbi:hypothetical protein Bca52824_023613 [Brassica carinata]|uniref:Uncharacterized protein n=1 Tax=Brassica carinata TaxID=52824 RepID=A0A8X7VIT5_BRACI|nr:hypothetical protein Bca52824_023613 [Brassica carinata]